MKVLVTGGAGYIGSVLIPMLLEAGHQVTALDRFDGVVTNTLAAACRFEGFAAVKGDCRDQRLLDDLVPKHDVLIPLAALVGAPLCAQDPLGAESINRDAVLALVRRTTKSQMVIYPNTNSGYGVGAADAFCTEDSELKPISLYGSTKCEAENAILDNGNCVTFRLATVFGMSPRMRIDLLVNDFTFRAVRDRAVLIFEGHFRRNYIHVRDVASAFMHGMENYTTMKGRPYNLGLSSANLSKLQLCAKIKELVPNFVYVEAPIGEDPDKRDYVVSNARLEASGWTPDWSLDRGIKELVQGYKMLRANQFANV